MYIEVEIFAQSDLRENKTTAKITTYSILLLLYIFLFLQL